MEMTLEQIDAELTKTLEILLETKINPGDDIKIGNPISWDSIKHIEIIMTVEQQFNISFQTEDIPLLTSKKALLDKINILKNHA